MPVHGVEQETVITFHDWREVDGLKYPFRMEVSNGQTVIFQSVEHNPVLDNGLFTMPAS